MLYSNRAFAHIRQENFGAADADAAAAIALDPAYAKAYYRRGEAHYARGAFRAAVNDFKAAARAAPRDPDARKKLAAAEKELQRARFEAALAMPDDSTSALDALRLEDMDVEASYTGPRMEEAPPAEGADSAPGAAGAAPPAYRLTAAFVAAMMEEFRAQRLVHRRFVWQVVKEAAAGLRALPSLVDVDVPPGAHITVCGDVHGQYYDLLRIFELNGLPSAANPYLFNGDFVDRGSFSVEIILTLLAFKALDPACIHLTRGNHESRSMNTLYGFNGEVKAKLGASGVEPFREAFCALPLAFTLNRAVFVVHGGIPTCPGGDLPSLRTLDRFREPPDSGPMCEMLWNDPQEEDGLTPNKRGVGVAWGPDVTRAWLAANDLKLVVRSHEVKDEGYEVAHGGYVVTIFSAPRYCDQMANKGAFIRFSGDDIAAPAFTQFEAAPHPDVRAMAYASNMMGGMMGM